jgi:dTDP-4-amino-4,6-dideoxygalactose transaminase
MNIPFMRFDRMHAPIRDALIAASTGVIDSGWYILGENVAAFEKSFADYCETGYAIGVGNGLEALHLALRVLKIGTGDEVIVPSNTYIATLLAVSYTGATPVLAEPRLATYNLDPDAFKAAITPRTRAVIPVHLYGQPCEMDAIMALSNEYGLKVIEDNAQSQGARYLGRRTGSWGHLNATSFYPGKNIGALGDGGALTTNEYAFDQATRKWRNYGSEVKYYNQVQGYNSRLDELQAAFLKIKLAHLDAWNQERQRLARVYTQALQNLGDLVLPIEAPGAESVYHLYVIRTADRNGLQEFLGKQGIGTLIHYPVPPHLQEAYRHQGWQAGQFPMAETIAHSALSLPLYPGLTDEEQAYIIRQIQSYFA